MHALWLWKKYSEDSKRFFFRGCASRRIASELKVRPIVQCFWNLKLSAGSTESYPGSLKATVCKHQYMDPKSSQNDGPDPKRNPNTSFKIEAPQICSVPRGGRRIREGQSGGVSPLVEAAGCQMTTALNSNYQYGAQDPQSCPHIRGKFLRVLGAICVHAKSVI